MIQIEAILKTKGECQLCKKEREVAKVLIDGKNEAFLCQKHVGALAELQGNGKEQK